MRLRKGQAARFVALVTLLATLLTIARGGGSGSLFSGRGRGITAASTFGRGQSLRSSSSSVSGGDGGGGGGGVQGPITVPALGRGPRWAAAHAQLAAEVAAAEKAEVPLTAIP